MAPDAPLRVRQDFRFDGFALRGDGLNGTIFRPCRDSIFNVIDAANTVRSHPYDEFP